MKVLVLGGAGFLGTNLVRHLVEEKKNSVLVVDSLSKRLKSTTDGLKDIWSEIEFVKGDMRDLELMKKVVGGKDVIYNCAGQTSHILSIRDPLYDVSINCSGNLTLLEAVRRINKKALVIYPSSSTAVNCYDVYSANKSVIEKYYQIHHRVYNLKTIVLRFGNLYGPYGKADSGFGFANYFISQAFKGKNITIYGDGKQTRNLMYVKDAVEVMRRCFDYPKLAGKTFWAVYRRHYQVLTVARWIVSVFGKGKIIKVKWPEVRKKIEIGKVKIDDKKLYRKIGWRPKYKLKEGLKDTKMIMEGI